MKPVRKSFFSFLSIYLLFGILFAPVSRSECFYLFDDFYTDPDGLAMTELFLRAHIKTKIAIRDGTPFPFDQAVEVRFVASGRNATMEEGRRGALSLGKLYRDLGLNHWTVHSYMGPGVAGTSHSNATVGPWVGAAAPVGGIQDAIPAWHDLMVNHTGPGCVLVNGGYYAPIVQWMQNPPSGFTTQDLKNLFGNAVKRITGIDFIGVNQLHDPVSGAHQYIWDVAKATEQNIPFIQPGAPFVDPQPAPSVLGTWHRDMFPYGSTLWGLYIQYGLPVFANPWAGGWWILDAVFALGGFVSDMIDQTDGGITNWIGPTGINHGPFYTTKRKDFNPPSHGGIQSNPNGKDAFLVPIDNSLLMTVRNDLQTFFNETFFVQNDRDSVFYSVAQFDGDTAGMYPHAGRTGTITYSPTPMAGYAGDQRLNISGDAYYVLDGVHEGGYRVMIDDLDIGPNSRFNIDVNRPYTGNWEPGNIRMFIFYNSNGELMVGHDVYGVWHTATLVNSDATQPILTLPNDLYLEQRDNPDGTRTYDLYLADRLIRSVTEGNVQEFSSVGVELLSWGPGTPTASMKGIYSQGNDFSLTATSDRKFCLSVLDFNFFRSFTSNVASSGLHQLEVHKKDGSSETIGPHVFYSAVLPALTASGRIEIDSLGIHNFTYCITAPPDAGQHHLFPSEAIVKVKYNGEKMDSEAVPW